MIFQLLGLDTNNASFTERGAARQNARSDRVCLDFLVLLDQAKRTFKKLLIKEFLCFLISFSNHQK
jgi:hypothetical protein